MSKIGKEGHRYAAACAADIRELSDYIKVAMYKLLEDDGGLNGCSCITDAVKTTLGNLELINYTTDFMIKHNEEEQSNAQ
tara:strand:- start:110 stop:349 length:240 start_codon:yes stop_codon:yes gene_type:complete